MSKRIIYRVITIEPGIIDDSGIYRTEPDKTVTNRLTAFPYAIFTGKYAYIGGRYGQNRI